MLLSRAILLGAIVLALFFYWAEPARAEGASLFLSPSSGTFYVGSTFNVSVVVNTNGNNINTVRADLKFDPKKLQVVNPTVGKSLIAIWILQPAYSNTDGKISFQGGVPSPGINNSAGLISTISFRVMQPGLTNVSFLNSSLILLDDGKGTNVLNSLNQGQYELTLPPPEGPIVFSPTHPDQNKWYKNNNPTLAWQREDSEGAEYSYSLDQDSQGVPDNIAEGTSTSVSFSNLSDGLWYFHIKAKKGQTWGGTTHYSLAIDTTAPAAFTIKVDPSLKTSVRQPLVYFLTTDALSGLDHYEVKTINLKPDEPGQEAGFFVEAGSPFQLPTLEQGKYLVVVRAFDKAGNWRDGTVKLEITPEGFLVNKDGLWFWGWFLPWWLLILFLLCILILVVIGLLLVWRRHRQIQKVLRQKIKQSESVLAKSREPQDLANN